MSLALAGEFVPDAVNVQAARSPRTSARASPLAEKLGRVFTALAGEVATQLDVEVRGEIAAHDVRVLELAALKGVFTDVVEDPVTYVNAPLLAKDRGVDVELVTDEDSPDCRNVVTVRGVLADGRTVSVSGTLSGRSRSEDHRSTATTSRSDQPTHLAFFAYADRPGIIGVVGKILGEAEVNIAAMQVARDAKAARR